MIEAELAAARLRDLGVSAYADAPAVRSGGLSDRDIASELTISPHTVHRHVSNILAKLGVPSRAAAAAYAGRHGVDG